MNRNYDEQTEDVDFSTLKGKTLTQIKGLEQGSELATLTCSGGAIYRMVYYDDCCASCNIEDVAGDVQDMIGHEILMAEEISSSEPDGVLLAQRRAEYDKEKLECESKGREWYYDSFEHYCSSRHESETWTFYKLATIKGSITIRWYGSSNGYYSESATFERVK